MRTRRASVIGSALFLIVAPGTIAGYLPWLIGGWRFDQDFGSSPIVPALGALLLLLGLAGLLESFARFAIDGLGTPAPIAPTQHLIASGLYRYVRNPMYVSVVAAIVGQALLFGQMRILIYAAFIWLAFHLFVLAYEEPTLKRQFPEEYARYWRSVPRWLPRMHPWFGTD